MNDGIDELELRDPDRAGVGVGTLSGGFGWVGADREPSDFALGFSAEVVGRRERWPLMIGLGVGVLTLLEPDSPQVLEWRHAEFLLRTPTFSGPLHPFAEVGLGGGGLWSNAAECTETEESDCDVMIDGDVAAHVTGGLGWTFNDTHPREGARLAWWLGAGLRWTVQGRGQQWATPFVAFGLYIETQTVK